MPAGWHAPKWWLPQAICIHQHEGAWNSNTGNGYYGGMQFKLSTWRSVGGSGQPDRASIREQLFRSWLVYTSDHQRWWVGDGGEWGNSARECGLK